MFGTFKMLASISMRNLIAHKWKTAIVGSIMFFGTFLVVVGTSLLDSIEASMSKSITQSVAGHLQVYDENARDKLALFGDGFMGAEDLGLIVDFARVKKELMGLENVKAVVPMGMDFAMVATGNELDQILDTLTQALKSGDVETARATRSRIEQAAELLVPDYELRREISSDTDELDRKLADLQRVLSPGFWDWMEGSPDEALQWLDTKIAPLAADGQVLYVRYMGTNLDAFTQHFDRFKIVDGEAVPKGRRGFLFNKKFYEKGVKHKIARELDAIAEAREKDGKTIAGDSVLRSKVKQMAREYPRISLQLEPTDAIDLEEALRNKLGDQETTLAGLLQAFLAVDDDNFDERYAFFYDTIAPKIRLYRFNIGDMITMRGVTQGGYLKTVTVKIYGTFTFKGLESNDLAAGHNLMDMMTYRDLFGLMTQERHREIASIRREFGVDVVRQEDVEASLFGSDASIVEDDHTSVGFDEFDGIDLTARLDLDKELMERTYTSEEMDSGVAVNAAIILKDPSKLQQSFAEVRQLSEDKNLGLQVVDWQTASGMVGQFTIVIRLVLYVAIFIIFMVALVIINNSMVMATMERIQEIGTMRAIGASRRFIMIMFLLETLALGVVAGSLGAFFAGGVVLVLGQVGLSAGGEDILVFLFSGKRLYPSVGFENLLMGFLAIMLVSIVSTLYPARVATRIQPIVAMQGKE